MGTEKRLKNLEDGYKWSKETVTALRAGDLSSVDMDSLIDEIESIFTGMERQLSDYLYDALKAKLRLQYVDPDDRENELALIHALSEMKSLLWAAPSVRDAFTEELIQEVYCSVRHRIEEEANRGTLPERCPYSRDEILNAVLDLEFVA
jgi:Domain of unknown function DUF29